MAVFSFEVIAYYVTNIPSISLPPLHMRDAICDNCIGGPLTDGGNAMWQLEERHCRRHYRSVGRTPLCPPHIPGEGEREA